MPVTYEVYALKAGNWNIDSVYDDRDMALYEARLLVESRHLTAVQVVQEDFDEATGQSRSKVIFKQQRGEAAKSSRKAPPQQKQTRTPAARPKPKPKPPPKGDPMLRYGVILVLSVGGLSLAVIVGLFFLMDYMK